MWNGRWRPVDLAPAPVLNRKVNERDKDENHDEGAQCRKRPKNGIHLAGIRGGAWWNEMESHGWLDGAFPLARDGSADDQSQPEDCAKAAERARC